MLKRKMSVETREKMSKAKIGTKRSRESVEKQRATMLKLWSAIPLIDRETENQVITSKNYGK
ncbi:hypothetical protein EZS27_022648 [termite gut metagenome]|uniref:Nuclease associated modular domain-containing protein n=1 Tax=termite gut metagenome TaxID=433724 RepID=A0A5J4R5S8_9ZZZZ